jgi:hypothetical protein
MTNLDRLMCLAIGIGVATGHAESIVNGLVWGAMGGFALIWWSELDVG